MVGSLKMLDTYCCKNCFDEKEIVSYVVNAKETGECDYCGSENAPICPAFLVGDFIKEGFLREYEDASNSVGYCSQDGGYLLPTSTIDEILIDREVIFSDSLEDPRILLEDLVSLDATPYVRKDPYGPPSGEPEEIDNWEDFCEIVTKQKPFTSFYPSEKDSFNQILPRNFLPHLAEYLYSHGLIYELGSGIQIYRGRLVRGEKHFGHEDLTSPSLENTKNNRMSPSGISFFYGCFDQETCVKEVRPSKGKKVAVATFEILTPLTILDLSEIPDSPEPISIFNENYGFSYESYFKPFLFHFGNAISKPLSNEESDWEYRPTQVLTEFIRFHKFQENRFGFLAKEKASESLHVNGIIYNSSLRNSGKNIVFFRGPDISTTLKEKRGDSWLFFGGQINNF